MKLLLIILLLSPSLYARDLRITWVKPSERQDNTPLKPEEISHFNMYYGTTKGDYQSQLELNGAAEEALISGLPDKDLYLVLTTVDTDGRESVYSTEIFSEFNVDKPDAPDTIVIEF